MLDDFLVHLFHQGECLEAYKLFGAHEVEENGQKGVCFNVYAPNAKYIFLIGEFNEWNESSHPMTKVSNGGIWSLFVPGVKQKQCYKYLIYGPVGQKLYKADPYAFYSELRPSTASRVYRLDHFRWSDKRWLKKQDKHYQKTLNIYEMHFGSWKMKKDFTDQEDGEYFNYEEMIDQIIPYVKEMGYTHIELMPLSEHPFDGSWGYQSTGYFSATSRYGEPKQLMKFINECHKNDIGVIMDFVPVHFVHDAHGLSQFDGGCVYEYPDDYRRYSEWGSSYFDLGRDEVRSFMMSAINFWIEVYHVDGIRFDAISHLIFWKGNKEAGTNDGAIDFMKRMTYKINERHPNVLLIAEDSSDYPKVTRSSVEGGLGFDYKWDLGWMNDTLKYLALDPIYRQYDHNLMTFSMAYFYSENYILPFSHDEVVHSKKTIIDKIYGTYEEKLAQLKTLYIYMMTHPGKKLNFMGNELAEYKEWDEKKSLGWNILNYPVHDAFHEFIKKLNQLVLDHPALYEYDYYPEGFEWCVVDDHNQSVFAYERKAKDGSTLLVVLNFTANNHEKYCVPVSQKGTYKEILNSDLDKYSGSNQVNKRQIKAKKRAALGKDYSIDVKIAPFAGMIFELKK